MSPILAIECSTGPASIALCHSGRVLAQAVEPKTHQQSRRLVPMVENIMQAAKMDYRDLACIAVTTGPGSFTGIRVGLAAARGFALAANIPARGIGTLEVLARQASSTMSSFPCFIIPAIAAGRGDYYVQTFKAINADAVQAEEEAYTADPASMNYALSLPLYLCGEGQEALAAALPAAELCFDITQPDARMLAKIAEERLQDESAAAVPLYVRPPAAKPNL